MKMNNKKNPDLLLLLVVFRQAIKLLIYLQRTQQELLALTRHAIFKNFLLIQSLQASITTSVGFHPS
jgi:hypothetical protein